MYGSDGERDDQEEAARLEAHPSFAAVLGRRCVVPSGDRYLCIHRRSLLASKRPLTGYAGALGSVVSLRSNRSCPAASRASDQHPPSTAQWSAKYAGRLVARRQDRDGGFLCREPRQTVHERGLLWVRSVARLPSAVSTNVQYRALQERQQQSLQVRTFNEPCPMRSGQPIFMSASV